MYDALADVYDWLVPEALLDPEGSAVAFEVVVGELPAGARVATMTRLWEDLEGGPFDAVFCVGNSITHARGRAGRRAALAAMRGVLRDGGLLAVTSRTWERPRQDGEEGVERGGRRALVRRTWHAGEPPGLEVAVTFEDDGTTHAERLEYWPFTHEELREDLLAAGLEPATSTHDPEAERYLVTARRR